MAFTTSGAFDEQILTTVNSTEELFQVYRYYFMRQILAALLVTFSIVGVFGNCFVIIAVALSKKLRTITNVFVVNLSISDLMSCVFLPWQAVAVLSEDGWPLPRAPWLCSLIGSVLIVGTNCSVTTLTLIALNRWIGITKSTVTTRRIYTRRNVVLMVLSSWILPIALIVVPPLYGIGELGYEPLYSTCSWIKDNPFSLLQNLLVAVGNFPIQLLVICCCYVSIFRYVLKTSRRMAQHDTRSVSGELSKSDHVMRKKMWKRQVAVTKNLVYIVLAYLICLAPFFVSIIPLGYDWSIRMTPYAAVILFMNSCVNPIIYAKSHPDFKEAFGYMIRCSCKAVPQSEAQSKMLQNTN